MNTKLILASQSPRRRELLQLLAIPFEVIPAKVEEKIDPDRDPAEEIQRLAQKKASWIFQSHPDSLVIGADTVVVIDGMILGKPKDQKEAQAMLHRLSDRTHQVITGVCLIDAKQTDCFVNITEVTFYPLSEEEIDRYTQSNEPLDKAGAYAIQGAAALFIKKIDGDYYSVMGLPIAEIAQHLKHF